MKLTWDDLMIQDINPADCGEYLQWYRNILPAGGELRFMFFNRLGEWFFQTRDLAVHQLSVLDGSCTQLAPSHEAFAALVNQVAWQEAHLWSREIFAWKQNGIIIGTGQVYAPAPHPVWMDGRLSEQIMPMDLRLWQWTAAQSLGLVQ